MRGFLGFGVLSNILSKPYPLSCAAITATSTTSCLVARSWWWCRGSWRSCSNRRRWSLKRELDDGLAPTGRERQGGTSTTFLNITVESQEFCKLGPHFSSRNLKKWTWAEAPAITSFTNFFNSINSFNLIPTLFPVLKQQNPGSLHTHRQNPR